MTRPHDFYRATAASGSTPSGTGSRSWRERLRRHPFDAVEAWFRAIPGPHVVLDVGCARLDLLRRLGGPSIRRIGMDLATFPEWKEARDILTLAADADERAFPFRDGQFTMVTAMMILEHVFDPFQFLREVRRVLRPGGVVILQVPNLGFLRHRLELLLGRLPVTSSRLPWAEIGWDGAHLHYFTQSKLAWLLTECGLAPVRWGGSGLFHTVRERRPALLCADLIAMARKTPGGSGRR